MRLHIGPPPENADFHPVEDGWTLLKEPRFVVLALMATVIGIALAIPTLWAWNHIATNARALTLLPVNSPLFFLLGMLVVVVIHEFVHAIAYPRFGLSKDTLIAFWPSKGTCYASYLGAMSRNRWLLVYVLPLLVLSVLPFLICMVSGVVASELKFVSVFNALCCGGDVYFALWLIMRQVPRKSLMRNQGWAQWWKA